MGVRLAFQSFEEAAASGGGGGLPVTTDRINYTFGTLAAALPAAPVVTNDWNPWGVGDRTTLVRVVTDQQGSVLGSLKGGTVGDIVVLENHGDGSGSYGAGDLRIVHKKTSDLTCDTGLITATVAVGGGNATYTRTAGGTGNYFADGFYIGQTVTWVGYANGGNNVTAVITNLSATVMTFALTTQVNEAGTGNEGCTANIVANHIYTPDLSDIIIPYTGGATLYYDAVTVGWIVIGLSVGGQFRSLDASQLIVSHPLTPAALAAGDTNDFDPSGGQWATGNAETTWLRLNADAAGSRLTGLVSHAQSGPAGAAQVNQGPIKIISNIGGPLTLANENAGSSAANRFDLPAGDVVIPPNGLAVLIYDMQGGGAVNQARWRLFSLNATSKLSLYKAITDTALGATVNDYNPTGFSSISRLRLAPSGASTDLTGLVAQEDGTIRTITAYGAGLKLKHQNAGSALANRFFLPGAVDITLNTGGSVTLVYDATFGAWFVLSEK